LGLMFFWNRQGTFHALPQPTRLTTLVQGHQLAVSACLTVGCFFDCSSAILLLCTAYVLAGYGGRNCAACPRGSYSGGGDFSACTTCPIGFTTAAAASTRREQCICIEGNGGGSCQLCPPGFWCVVEINIFVCFGILLEGAVHMH
jgi:hypothetical protein